MQAPSWSKKRIILLCSLAGVAVLGLVVLFALLLSRPDAESPSLPADGEGALPKITAELQQKSWTLSAQPVNETEAPAPVLTFREDEKNPLPEDGSVLMQGEALRIGGTVYSNRKLTAVTVSISCAHNSQKPYPYRKSVQLSDRNTGSYSFTSTNTDSGKALADLVDFSELLVGAHTLKITASCDGLKSAELFRCKFYVVGTEWENITEESFPDSYPEALRFFGDPSRFLYRYQWVNGRYILADPEWEKEYITTIRGYPKQEPWLVHTDSVSYFEKAFSYLETSFVRVHGTNGDTGLIRASDLITEYNGCYVSRFTSSLKAISHHTFGTAVDVNASMEPNKNTAENKAVIDDDVRGHLFFNGLKEEKGVIYYDFSYDGSYDLDPNGVPQTCVNYLLYEMGFYRAGFGWAHYYKSTSDGMHFCLSEFITYSHDDKENGLRKVYVYAPPVKLESPLPELAAPETTPVGSPKDAGQVTPAP